jgi:hypothetical protein
MGRAVAVRADYTADEVRRLAKQAKDGAQARRLLAIAAVLDRVSRTEAVKIGGVDRQTLREWVIRFNDQGADVSSTFPLLAYRQSLTPRTAPFWPESWRKARPRRSTAWCGGGPAI